jgi:Protein of unknown function (DUF2624).
MKFLENIINMKINGITGKELRKYGRIFNIPISEKEAEQIAAYLRGKNIDIFNERQRSGVIREIARIAGPETARQVNRLIIEWTRNE